MSIRYNDKDGTETLLSGLTQGDNTAIPDGGDTNQVLAKNSTTDRDLKWATTETLIKKGQNNGVASLGSDGKVPLGQIPEIPETNNLLIFPYVHPTTRTSGGVIFTINEDGSCHAKGTLNSSSTYVQYNFATRGSAEKGVFLEKGKTYTFSGCPAGGSDSTFRLRLVYNTDASGSTSRTFSDYGEGCTFTVEDDYYGDSITLFFQVLGSGNTYDVTCYPMLVEGDTIQPYQNPIDESKSIVNRMYEVEKHAAKNLIPFPYDRPNIYTQNGITWTVNADGSIAANGTATAQSNYACELLLDGYANFKIPEGNYVVSGCPAGGGYTSTWDIWVAELLDSGSFTVLAREYGDGCSFTVDAASANRPKQVVCTVFSGQTVNNLTFYPMLERGILCTKEYKSTTKEPDNRLDFVENNSTKNLISFPYDFTTIQKDNRGVTFTVNKDGSITSVGTVNNTSGSYANILAADRTRVFLPGGSYTLSAHSESARTGIMLYFWNAEDTTQKYSRTYQGLISDSSNTYILTSESGTISDLGKGINYTKHFTLGSDAYITGAVRTIRSTDLDATVNETLYFMLEKGFVEHDYVPTVSEAEYNNYYNKLNITGGTLTGDLTIAPTNHNADIFVGQNTVNGYEGFIHIYGKDATDATTNVNRKIALKAGSKLTADRTFTFPNASGEIMTTAGGTITGGNFAISRSSANSVVTIGQSSVNGYTGYLRIYGKDATDATTNANRYAEIRTDGKLTANRAFWFPDYGGQIEVRQVNNAAVKLTTTNVARKTFTFTDSKITSQNCFYYKIDHRVVVYVAITASASLTTNLTYTIPEGYRPLVKKYAADIHTLQASTSHPVLTVDTDGVVTVLPVNQTSINMTLEYDAWQ